MSSEGSNITEDERRRSDDDALAAELALGVLDGDARREAEAKALNNPEFFRRVAAWQARLGALTQTISAVSPPAHLWTKIENRLFGPPALTSQVGKSIWSSLFFWRGMTLALASLSAVLGIFMMMNTVIYPAPATPLIATLQAQNAGPIFLAHLNRDTNSLTIRPISNKDDAAHDLELWLIPGDKVARSLGVLSKSGATQVIIPETLQRLAGPDAILAVTVEPPGGSPTGKATGPIIAVGPLTKL